MMVCDGPQARIHKKSRSNLVATGRSHLVDSSEGAFEPQHGGFAPSSFQFLF